MHTRKLALVLTLLFASVATARAVAEEARPNLILIFTDDQRFDAVGYAGNTAVSTPHLDALAREALVFENCYVNTSICAVNRANVMAGQYPGRHGIDDFFKVFSEQQLRDTVPGRLQAAGYQTAFFGKWGIGDSPEKTHAAAEVFDYWAGQPMQTCFFHEPDCRYVNFDGFEPAARRPVRLPARRPRERRVPQPDRQSEPRRPDPHGRGRDPAAGASVSSPVVIPRSPSRSSCSSRARTRPSATSRRKWST